MKKNRDMSNIIKNENVKLIITFLEKRDSTYQRIVRKCKRRFLMTESDVKNHIELMLDLKLVKYVSVKGGDDWNTSYTYNELTLTDIK